MTYVRCALCETIYREDLAECWRCGEAKVVIDETWELVDVSKAPDRQKTYWGDDDE